MVEPEAQHYEAADEGEPASTRPDADEQNREDLICRIRHMFGDGNKMKRWIEAILTNRNAGPIATK